MVIGIVIMFIFFALQFDLYKWSIFIASSTTLERYDRFEQQLLFEKRQKCLKLALIISQLSILSSFSIFSGLQVKYILNIEKYVPISNHRNIFMSVLFSIFLVIYLAVFLKLILQLKMHFPHFFENEKQRIYILGSIILFSILCRITTSLIYG